MQRSLAIVVASLSGAWAATALAAVEPVLVEKRTFELTQSVTLHDVPQGAKRVRLWVPIPSDSPWQRVTDRSVLSAPGEWRLVRQSEGRGDFIYVEVDNPHTSGEPGSLSVVVSCTVERQGVHFPIETAAPVSSPIQDELFREFLDRESPLMEVDERIQQLADSICGDERDPARQAVMLLRAVAAQANHYSKDSTVPTCGIGSAYNCLKHGGGCCTDLHSLFVALARARNIPVRIQFGYRTLDSRDGQIHDPGYRCWVEFFVPGAGWVPTDIVASDGTDPSHPMLWGSLSANRVWLWEGRSFELNPKAKAGPIHTMLCGWAEIDGVPVNVLPEEDKTPSRLRRIIQFTIVDPESPRTASLPQ